jgi:hypothetical protein
VLDQVGLLRFPGAVPEYELGDHVIDGFFVNANDVAWLKNGAY